MGQGGAGGWVGGDHWNRNSKDSLPGSQPSLAARVLLSEGISPNACLPQPLPRWALARMSFLRLLQVTSSFSVSNLTVDLPVICQHWDFFGNEASLKFNRFIVSVNSTPHINYLKPQFLASSGIMV